MFFPRILAIIQHTSALLYMLHVNRNIPPGAMTH